MELRRKYNTVYLNGSEASQIVIMTDDGYQIFDDSSFYLDKVASYGGQDYEIDLVDIKKGNKTLFKNCGENMPVIKNRVIPKQSIPYGLRKKDRYYGDGDWLFLWPDNVEVKEEVIDVGQKNTSIRREYHISIQGYNFVCVKHVSNTNLKQANEVLFSNLEDKICSYNYKSHREYLEAKIYLLDCISTGKIRIKKGLLSEDNWGTKKQGFIVAIYGEDDFHTERIDLNRQVEIDTFLDKYDVNRIIRSEAAAWL